MSADEAWLQYLMSGESVDLVFTDHRMPGSMTGAQLAIRIRREYPSLVVIVTSAYFDDQGWSEPVVAKPYNPFESATDLAERARNRGSLSRRNNAQVGSGNDPRRFASLDVMFAGRRPVAAPFVQSKNEGCSGAAEPSLMHEEGGLVNLLNAATLGAVPAAGCSRRALSGGRKSSRPCGRPPSERRALPRSGRAA